MALTLPRAIALACNGNEPMVSWPILKSCFTVTDYWGPLSTWYKVCLIMGSESNIQKAMRRSVNQFARHQNQQYRFNISKKKKIPCSLNTFFSCNKKFKKTADLS
jgi:hypothetical protein